MEDDRTVLMSARALAPGYKIHWYTIVKVLGQGGFGITYLARDTNLDRDVAIKEYLPVSFAYRRQDYSVKPITGDHRDNYTWGLGSFLKEAQTLARFGHDNIVRVHSVFEANSTAYMVMAYEHGQSLSSIYSAGTLVDQSFFESTFFPIFDGLEAIHKLGFIHRDIKPANIYVREDSTPVLIDFGSARQTSLQQTGEMTTLVSKGYTPLEQYSANYGDQGPWTDIYALAATIYEGIVGNRPEESLSRSACLMRRKPDALAPLDPTSFPGFEPSFLRAVLAGLALEPEARPQALGDWHLLFDGDARLDSTRMNDDLGQVSAHEPDGQGDDTTRIRSRHRYGSSERESLVTDAAGPAPAVPSAERSDHDVFDFDIQGLELDGHESDRRSGGSRSREHSRSSSGKSKRGVLRPAAAVLAVVGLAGGVFWWMSMSSSSLTLDAEALARLPTPASPVETILPKEQVLGSLDDQIMLADLYAKAYAIRPDDPELQASIQRAYDDLIAVSSSWSASRHRDIADQIVKAAGQLPDVADRRSTVRSSLEASATESDLNALLAMLKAQRYVQPTGASVLDRVNALGEQDFQRVKTSGEWLDMMSRLRASAMSSLSNADFEQTARIVVAALTLDPTNPDMIALREHLSQ